jgi:maltooligosyltrehalose trehalohydrolase
MGAGANPDGIFGPGPRLLGSGRCRFSVWAPHASTAQVHLLRPVNRMEDLHPLPRGYWQAVLDNVWPGATYRIVLDGKLERPDPASRYQPEGVHGPSEIVDLSYEWRDGLWLGLPLAEFVLYELHVGAFTPEGTFDAVIPHLPCLAELGVTVLELMPVAQFPGTRNWGYDGVFPFAVQKSYGGPAGLKRLVDACHQAGLGVTLDVVYNHLGPEGNYLGDFAPYFTDRYRTPWGAAMNFDGPWSDEVRRYIVGNALYWLSEFHIDALRLDAVHAIVDTSARPLLAELSGAVHDFSRESSRLCYVMAESDLNDPRLVRSKHQGGYELDAVWNDGFHHALRVLLTGESGGYYCDFGELAQLGKAYREGFVYSGEYSKFRRRRHGASSADVPAEKFVVFCQNHDQVGNRMLGERLAELVDFESLKLAAAAVLLSPFLPLLFMGEEYGERAPFLFFVDHSAPELIEAVRRGRKEEFAPFAWQGQPPDPQDAGTFLRSKLNHQLRGQQHHAVLHSFYAELLRLRRQSAALRNLSKDDMETRLLQEYRTLLVRRWTRSESLFFTLCFSDKPVRCELPVPEGRWRKLLDSSDPAWRGPGAALPQEIESTGTAFLRLNPRAVVLYQKEA